MGDPTRRHRRRVVEMTVDDLDRMTFREVLATPIAEWEEAGRDILASLQRQGLWAPRDERHS